MKPVAMIRSAIQSAKNRLQDRAAQQQAAIAAEAARTAEELKVLDEHAAIMVTAEHLAASYEGAASNLEALLASNPLKTVVGNMRGFCFPGVEAFEPLAGYYVAKLHKAEILRELKAQTIDLSDQQIGTSRPSIRPCLRSMGWSKAVLSIGPADMFEIYLLRHGPETLRRSMQEPCRRTALRAKAGHGLPRGIKLLKYGGNPSTQGLIRVGAATAEMLPVNARNFGRETVPIDFEHGTEPGTREYQLGSEPRPVAGYGSPRIVPGDGLYLDDIEWTEIGAENAANYRDLSPAVSLNADGEVVFVSSVALTRTGAVHGLLFPEGLVTLSAGALQGKASPGITQRRQLVAPDMLDLLPWGPGRNGEWIVNEASLELLPENQKLFGLNQVPVIIPGRVTEIAGHGTPEIQRGSGIRLLNIEWTDAGRREIQRFTGVKPSLMLGYGKEVVGLNSVWLSTPDHSVDYVPLPGWFISYATNLSRAAA